MFGDNHLRLESDHRFHLCGDDYEGKPYFGPPEWIPGPGECQQGGRLFKPFAEPAITRILESCVVRFDVSDLDFLGSNDHGRSEKSGGGGASGPALAERTIGGPDCH